MLRKIDLDVFPPLDSHLVTLILVPASVDRFCEFATSPGEKVELLTRFAPTDRCIAVWVGQYASDAFKVTREVAEFWLRGRLSPQRLETEPRQTARPSARRRRRSVAPANIEKEELPPVEVPIISIDLATGEQTVTGTHVVSGERAKAAREKVVGILRQLLVSQDPVK